MSLATSAPPAPHTSSVLKPALSLRKNGNTPTPLRQQQLTAHPPGKHWHAPKPAFRPTAGQTSYAARLSAQKAAAATKAKEREMKEEKAAARQVSAACLHKELESLASR